MENYFSNCKCQLKATDLFILSKRIRLSKVSTSLSSSLKIRKWTWIWDIQICKKKSKNSLLETSDFEKNFRTDPKKLQNAKNPESARQLKKKKKNSSQILNFIFVFFYTIRFLQVFYISFFFFLQGHKMFEQFLSWQFFFVLANSSSNCPFQGKILKNIFFLC